MARKATYDETQGYLAGFPWKLGARDQVQRSPDEEGQR